ncbi:MAG: hypothetical protein ABSB01_11450 [Streptosporangiaceae bacterium]
MIRSAPPSSAADANSAKPQQRMLTCGQLAKYALAVDSGVAV